VGTLNATTDLKCTKSPDGIPPRTLKRRIDTNNTVKAGMGPTSIFGAESEQKIVRHVIKLQQHVFSPTR
jgi:hypothetical protein